MRVIPLAVGIVLGLSACAAAPDYDPSAFSNDTTAYGFFDYGYCGDCGDWRHPRGEHGWHDHHH